MRRSGIVLIIMGFVIAVLRGFDESAAKHPDWLLIASCGSIIAGVICLKLASKKAI
jgi:hypothetical protein